MKTYSEIIEAAKKNKGGVDDHKKKAEIARKDAAALRELRTKAIEDGRQEDFINICQEIEYHEQRARFESEKARAGETQTQDILTAWEEYAADYNKELSKKLGAYEKARKHLAAEYLEILRTVAEGNKERQALRADLEGRTVGRYNAIETATELVKPQTVKRHTMGNYTAEAAITADVMQLDFGRLENIAYIEQGGYVNDISEESLTEILAKSGNRKSIFPYPVIIETEEEENLRRIRGGADPKTGYIYV